MGKEGKTVPGTKKGKTRWDDGKEEQEMKRRYLVTDTKARTFSPCYICGH